MLVTLANFLSVLRLLLAGPTAWAVTQGWWSSASILLALAIISDIADGRIARRRGQDSATGGLLDHSCDAVYVVTVLVALSSMAMVPLLLPVLIAAAFLQYVLDSNVLRGKNLRTNELGRLNGIAYFVLLVGAISAQLMIPGTSLDQSIYFVGWILVVTTLLSMVDRLWALLRPGRLK